MSSCQRTVTPSVERLERAVAALEDAEIERDAAVAEALDRGCSTGLVAEAAGLTESHVLAIAETWGVAPAA